MQTAEIYDLCERRKSRCRHRTLDRAYQQIFTATTRRLADEVNIIVHVNEWAETFPDECWSDPVFMASAGLAL